MEREDARWNVKMRDGTWRCVMECEDVQERKDARWNAKMHSEMWRCAMEHKDVQWNAKMRDYAN